MWYIYLTRYRFNNRILLEKKLLSKINNKYYEKENISTLQEMFYLLTCLFMFLLYALLKLVHFSSLTYAKRRVNRTACQNVKGGKAEGQ